ncbi:MAG: sigma-70 family RNA polymerase sigma factor [Pseudomonadota bacterium]
MSFNAKDQTIDNLYRDHHGWLKAWLSQGSNCSETAADLAQDTFVRLLQRNLDGIAVREPRAYLKCIARGLLIDYWRRRDLEIAWQETLANLPQGEAVSPEVSAVLFETLKEIDQMLSCLKPVVRRAFLLAQLEGYSCRQVAETLNVSLSTAERYVAKALRRCYEFHYES